MITVKLATFNAAVLAWVEIRPDAMEFDGTERCFRFDDEGRAEYAFHRDLMENGERARWYGHVYTQRDFVFT